MALNVTVHHPDRPGSTIKVTEKAYATLYADKGYLLADGGTAATRPSAAEAALRAELERTRAQLAEAQAGNAGAKAPSTPAEPRKRAPRKRTRPATTPAPAADAAPTKPPLATGPADIDSAPALD